MPNSLIALALLRFTAWELAILAASLRLSRFLQVPEDTPEDRWFRILAIDVTLESTIAAAFSFAGINSPAAYWIAALLLAAVSFGKPLLAVLSDLGRPAIFDHPRAAALMAALAVPAFFVAFRPVDEIDSVNYLHYVIDWMANRATPYTFSTYYVSFWELSFLPSWTVTHLDNFFPLIALKAPILLALAAWLIGRELRVPTLTLAWAVFGAFFFRHYWLEHSGVATLKNDPLHGVGFLLLALLVLRAARRPMQPSDAVLLGLGLAFGTVKFLGVFTCAIAFAALLWITRRQPGRLRLFATASAIFLLTSGHYYLRSVIRYRNPFYPFQINLGPIHLPGEADLSGGSIFHNLRNPELWRAIFLPAGAVSPAGILFPEIVVGAFLLCGWICLRRLFRRDKPAPVQWLAFLIVCACLLYCRASYSAGTGPGDLAFIRNNLNSLRYIDGPLAAAEILLVAFLGRFALPLVLINAASRLLLIYDHVPAAVVAALAVTVLLACWAAPRRAWLACSAVLIAAAPWIVEANRVPWTTYWNPLKPALAAVRGPNLAAFAMDEGSYWAGHVVAAGNPIDPSVRALLPEDLDALAPAARPRYLAVLVTPGFDWRPHYAARLAAWGYRPILEVPNGALLQR